MQSHLQRSIPSLKSEIDNLRQELSKVVIQEMSVPPLTDAKLAFWRQRGVLAERYYQLGTALESEKAYEDAVMAYWESYQINQNDSASKKLWIGNSKAIASGALLKIETDLPAAKYFYLGLQYLSGLGHSQNDAQAVACFKSAAEQGYAPAQNNLGFMYQTGRGVPRDDAQAVNWLRRAAEQGDAAAQTNFGVRYRGYTSRLGVLKDNAKAEMHRLAANWYQLAAEQGYANAQTRLGVMYSEVEGVLQDDTQALHWTRLAAEQGQANAQANLAVWYADGQGVLQDYTQALHWSRRALEQGNAHAQTILGWMYEHESQLVPIEAGSAKEYRRDYKNGIRDALKMLRICKNKLRDFESRYHYAVASYSPLKDKIIGAYLSDLIKKEPNEILEAVINDDLLSASERKAFLQKIFEAHRRDKKHSGFLGFFQPASTSQLSDENYVKLCYGMGSQLYETAELRKYPDRIAQAKIYYNQVPQTSTFYRKAMSELFDLEIGLDWVEQLRDETQSTEAREDKLWGLHAAFFKGKGIESGHEALDTYNEFEAAIRTMKDH